MALFFTAAADPPTPRLSRAVFGELTMRALISLLQVFRARRLAPVVAAVGVLALLSGCVIYPVGGGWHRDHYYGH